MCWLNLEDEWPMPNSIVVVCYQDLDNDDNFMYWTFKIVPEKYIGDLCDLDKNIYWTYLPVEKNETTRI